MRELEFDEDKSIAAGIAGAERAYKATTQEWRDRTYEVIKNKVTVNLPEWHVDEVWKADPSLMDGTDLRAIGGVLRKAVKDGLIEKIPCPTCSRYKVGRSSRVDNNGTFGTIWRSVNYKVK